MVQEHVNLFNVKCVCFLQRVRWCVHEVDRGQRTRELVWCMHACSCAWMSRKNKRMKSNLKDTGRVQTALPNMSHCRVLGYNRNQDRIKPK